MSTFVRDTGWFKSSFSAGDSDNCVEVRLSGHEVRVRDTKNPTVSLVLPAGGWRALIASLGEEAALAA